MKKILKIMLVLLMFVGITISVINFNEVSLNAQAITNADAHYHPGLNDCFDPPYACFIVKVKPKR